VFVQDVLVVCCPSDFYHKTKVLATARMALKRQGIAGLNQAPCLRALISSLPIILREQHTYEKVDIVGIVRYMLRGLRIIDGCQLMT